jgi:hypothetical protein
MLITISYESHVTKSMSVESDICNLIHELAGDRGASPGLKYRPRYEHMERIDEDPRRPKKKLIYKLSVMDLTFEIKYV